MVTTTKISARVRSADEEVPPEPPPAEHDEEPPCRASRRGGEDVGDLRPGLTPPGHALHRQLGRSFARRRDSDKSIQHLQRALDLYRTSGPRFDAFDGTKLVAAKVGTAKFTFADGNNATFAYTVQLAGMASPVTQSKAITREIFTSPGTTCK